MRQINKIVLLSDENTTVVGKDFLEHIQAQLEMNGLQVWRIDVNLKNNLADAIYQFDRISLEIKPELLVVADFACIKMQSPEEEPFYNNMSIPVIHLLFRRPWEYEVFMIWRSNFIDRYYCLVPEDVSYVRVFYQRLPNVKHFWDGLWNAEEKQVCYQGQYRKEELVQAYQELPDYIKTIAKRWAAMMRQNNGLSDAEGLRQCLKEIGFDCSEAEYQDIVYMLRYVFALYNYECHQKGIGDIHIREDVMRQQMEEFLDLDFEISLL